MNTLWQLYFEFFKTGLFSIGGGMATFPFLKEMGEKTGWFTNAQLMDMLAVSESTPGPIGINMATYVGYSVAGVPGGIIATLGEITPSVIIIILVAKALESFRKNPYVEKMFYGLRPASAGLIAAAAAGIFMTVIFPDSTLSNVFIPGLIFGVILYILTNYVKWTKKLHPIWFILLSAAVGIILNW